VKLCVFVAKKDFLKWTQESENLKIQLTQPQYETHKILFFRCPGNAPAGPNCQSTGSEIFHWYVE
jgi:hypothetical protein